MKVLRINNISKYYSISKYSKKNRLFSKKIKENKNNDKNGRFWALQDISFNVNQGEVLGIIGPNGSGKSTLLKIVSGITSPSQGQVRLNGRVGSLLEVGTGFHGELSGRENIFLNGAILGMSRKEIENNFDQIVEFSGIDNFLDVPVKKYSSGMSVRLAFSVAAHLQPEILLVDEVLSVGDFSFRQKCLDKMNEISQNNSRTILFVSHNMEAVESLCTKCVFLNQGEIKSFGYTKEVVNDYLESCSPKEINNQASYEYSEDQSKKVQIKTIKFLDSKQNLSCRFDTKEAFFIEVEYEVKEDIKKHNRVSVRFYRNASLFLEIMDIDTNKEYYQERSRGRYRSKFMIPANTFNHQRCQLRVTCGVSKKEDISGTMNGFFDQKDNLQIEFYNKNNFISDIFSGKRRGDLLLQIPCEIKKI